MKRFAILTVQFYRVVLQYNIAFTLIAQVLLSFGGIKLNAISFFVAKIFGFPFAIGLHYHNSKNEYFYFRNMGCSMRWILAAAYLADLLIYAAIVSISSLLSHA